MEAEMSRPDFPKTIIEFQKRFSDEAECLKYLIDSRWPNGFVCPRCGWTEFYWHESRKLQRGHTNPSGQRELMRYFRHSASSEKRF